MPNYTVLEDVEIDGRVSEKGLTLALDAEVAKEYVEAGFLEEAAEVKAPEKPEALGIGSQVLYQTATDLIQGKVISVNEDGTVNLLVAYGKNTFTEKGRVSQGYELGQYRLNR